MQPSHHTVTIRTIFKAELAYLLQSTFDITVFSYRTCSLMCKVLNIINIHHQSAKS